MGEWFSEEFQREWVLRASSHNIAMNGSRKGQSDGACGWSVVQLQGSRNAIDALFKEQHHKESGSVGFHGCHRVLGPCVVRMLMATRTVEAFLRAEDQDGEVCIGT